MHLLAKLCPTHKVEMIGGPVQYYCEAGRHTVQAADIPHERPGRYLVHMDFDIEDAA